MSVAPHLAAARAPRGVCAVAQPGLARQEWRRQPCAARHSPRLRSASTSEHVPRSVTLHAASRSTWRACPRTTFPPQALTHAARSSQTARTLRLPAGSWRRSRPTRRPTAAPARRATTSTRGSRPSWGPKVRWAMRQCMCCMRRGEAALHGGSTACACSPRWHARSAHACLALGRQSAHLSPPLRRAAAIKCTLRPATKPWPQTRPTLGACSSWTSPSRPTTLSSRQRWPGEGNRLQSTRMRATGRSMRRQLARSSGLTGAAANPPARPAHAPTRVPACPPPGDVPHADLPLQHQQQRWHLPGHPEGPVEPRADGV